MKKLILLLTLFIIIISSQISYSKSIPPGSGAGDVPANILFLLDSSASMDQSMSAPGTAVGYATDLVQLSDGNIIIAIGSKLIKMFLEDVILDTSIILNLIQITLIHGKRLRVSGFSFYTLPSISGTRYRRFGKNMPWGLAWWVFS